MKLLRPALLDELLAAYETPEDLLRFRSPASALERRLSL